MIKGIAHVCIGATDLAAVERFYCGCLGFTKKFDFLRQGKVIGFYLQVAPNSFIEFFQSDSVPQAGSPIRHICLETDDIDGVIARVKQCGYQIGEKKVGSDHSPQVWIKDAPDGVAIEFHQYTPESAQITGKTVIANW
jgi:catechol 2,3-dioxygenase-like lactoylglutathione lyase family enzyme